MKNLIVFFIILLLFSCKSKQVATKEIPIQYREVVTTRLVPVLNPVDSLNLVAIFECDSLNRVILKQLSEAKSKNLNSQSDFENGKFKYVAKTDPKPIYITVKDTARSKDVPVYIDVPGPEINVLTWWQTMQIYAGRLFFVLALLWGVWIIFKPKLLI